MSVIGPRPSARRAIAVAVVGLSALTGCATERGPSPPEDRVTVLRIELPVREPDWARGALYALSEHTSQVVRIDPPESSESSATRTARTTLSAPLPEVGENVATSLTGREAVYVPQPALDRVAMLGLPDLRQLGTFQAGPAPSIVALDVGSQVLLALSEDGSTVTGVRLRGLTPLPPQDVRAGPAAELDGPARGRLIEYHVTGPRGIAHYKGATGDVRKKAEIAIRAHKTTGDLTKVSRVYVAEQGTTRLLAVGTTPAEDGLAVAAEADLGEPVEHLGVDATRIYAATRNKLVVLETNSYEGYQDNKFTLVDTIDFRRTLKGVLGSAPLSGLAVGDNRIYLTFKDQPAVVSIAKPGI